MTKVKRMYQDTKNKSRLIELVLVSGHVPILLKTTGQESMRTHKVSKTGVFVSDRKQ